MAEDGDDEKTSKLLIRAPTPHELLKVADADEMYGWTSSLTRGH
jgi:hypothetical protein